MGFHTVDDIIPRILPATAKAVLLALAYHNDDKTGRCDPSVARLCQITCLCKRAVVRAIQILEEEGVITTVHALGIRSRYTINRCTSDTGASGAPVHERTKTGARHVKTGAPRAPNQNIISNRAAAPLPWRAEAIRLLERAVAGSRPHWDDLQSLKKAAEEGDYKAWKSFDQSTEGATRSFRKRNAEKREAS